MYTLCMALQALQTVLLGTWQPAPSLILKSTQVLLSKILVTVGLRTMNAEMLMNLLGY